jgi:hypothetical protein
MSANSRRLMMIESLKTKSATRSKSGDGVRRARGFQQEREDEEFLALVERDMMRKKPSAKHAYKRMVGRFDE